MAEPWPFGGRDDDLAAAARALTRHGAVVLGGSAGVGKSRLARELATRAGGPVGVVRATASSRDLPLGAFADVLTGTAGGPPDLAQIHRSIGALRTDGTTRLLVVDDAHQLDDVSATVVHQLVTHRRARVILTVRTGEQAPDAVTALWKDDLAPRIEIAPLDRVQTLAVLGQVLGSGLGADTARRMHDTARGNLLWLRHLVDGERAAGRLRRAHGDWVWDGQLRLSPALNDLVAARLGVLSDAQRRVLELLSVAEPIGLGMLTDLAGDEPVEDVAQRGLVLVEPDGERWEVRLGHPLYGEVVRDRTSEPRSRRLRGELSAALASTPARRAGDGLRRAVLDLGSDRPLDPSLLVAAASQAGGLGDFALAERLLRAAVAAGGGFPARSALAYVLMYLMREEEADEALAEAAADATTPEERVRAVCLRAFHAHFTTDPPRRGEEVIARARAEAADGQHDAPGYDAFDAALLVTEGRIADGVAHGDGVLADPHAPPDAVVFASWGVAYGRALSGVGEALGLLIDRGIAAAAQATELAPLGANIGLAEVLDADLRGQPETARRRVDWVRSLTGAQAPVLAALYEGRVHVSAGLPRAAIASFQSALPAFPGHGGGWSGWLLAQVAQCHAMLGEVDAARKALDEGWERRHPNVPVLNFEFDLARAWIAAAEGNAREAVSWCRQGAERTRGSGAHAAEVLLLQTAVRFGDRDQGRRLGELHGMLDTPRARLAAAHAAALAALDPDRLLEVAVRLEESGMGLEAADAAGQAAATARSHQRVVLAAEAEERARALALSGQNARTPAVLGAEAPVPLSAREREVAVLASQGLTNRQIAERLHVSVRTVESHVYRACSRLGLSDRSALVAVATGTARTGQEQDAAR